MDIAAFADYHVNGNSVTAKLLPNMEDSTSIAYSAWISNLALGWGNVNQMEDVWAQIEVVQPAP